MKKKLYRFIGISLLILAGLPNEFGCNSLTKKEAGISERNNPKEVNEKDLDPPIWFIQMK